ncbi:signal peptidase complex subunit 3 [Nematocida parisii]|nr:signal peptidase complex subunit 3 [Nematocida parisii]KAI5131212.1 signal peptidase complex subunit 3 [Nematocida parisii]KAI5144892.1 signal peptidase complex subunit 3 [Nematocida parisii]
MNTSAKRLGKVISLISSYTGVLVMAIFISTFILNRDTPQCTPTLHVAEPAYIKFTPNVDITSTVNYNVKEVFVYLVHKTHINNVEVEQIVWSTLAKKKNDCVLINECMGRSNDANKPLSRGKFILKATYFPYIGFIKNKTFAEFPVK